MDDSVIRAMARWPNVPAVYGWLSLDRRGAWRLRGDPVIHRGAVEFIKRNYACNDAGQWYFQNGPQRVFVDLEYTPWIYLLDGAGALVTHTGLAVAGVRGAWLDEDGQLLLASEHGAGLVCDRDLEPLSERLRRADGGACEDADLEAVVETLAGAPDARGGGVQLELEIGSRRVPVSAVRRAEVPGRFAFDPRPRAADGSVSG